MRLIAVLGALFVLASCSDSDMGFAHDYSDLEFEYKCDASGETTSGKVVPYIFYLNFSEDKDRITMTLAEDHSFKAVYYFSHSYSESRIYESLHSDPVFSGYPEKITYFLEQEGFDIFCLPIN